jgi:hypothetical protein
MKVSQIPTPSPSHTHTHTHTHTGKKRKQKENNKERGWGGDGGRLGIDRRASCMSNTVDSYPQWALTYCYLSQSTASQNEKSTRCHQCWGLILPPPASQRTALTTQPSPTSFCVSLSYTRAYDLSFTVMNDSSRQVHE